MNLLDKVANKVVQGNAVQKVNKVLSARQLKEFKNRSNLSYAIRKKRSLTPVEQTIVDTLGWKGAGELGITRKQVDDLIGENKELRGTIVDLSPGILRMSLVTRIFATINLVLLLAFITGGVLIHKHLDDYLYKETQRFYNKELVKERERAWERILGSAEGDIEHYEIELKEKKEEIKSLKETIEDLRKKADELDEKLRGGK